MPIGVSSNSPPGVAQPSFLAASERYRPVRSSGGKRRCVLRQYEELIPYQQVRHELLLMTSTPQGDHLDLYHPGLGLAEGTGGRKPRA